LLNVPVDKQFILIRENDDASINSDYFFSKQAAIYEIYCQSLVDNNECITFLLIDLDKLIDFKNKLPCQSLNDHFECFIVTYKKIKLQ